MGEFSTLLGGCPVSDPLTLSIYNVLNFLTCAIHVTSFQMVSLLKLAKVTEEGVRFLSPHDGTPM